MLVFQRLWFRRHHSGQWATAGETSWKNVPTFRLYKWRSAMITQNWTLHFKSGASGPVERYYSIFFICGLWFWLWDHQINPAPVPLQWKISPDSFSVTTRPGWRPGSDGVSLQEPGGRPAGIRQAPQLRQRVWNICRRIGEPRPSSEVILKAYSNELITNLSARTSWLGGIIPPFMLRMAADAFQGWQSWRSNSIICHLWQSIWSFSIFQPGGILDRIRARCCASVSSGALTR